MGGAGQEAMGSRPLTATRRSGDRRTFVEMYQSGGGYCSGAVGLSRQASDIPVGDNTRLTIPKGLLPLVLAVAARPWLLQVAPSCRCCCCCRRPSSLLLGSELSGLQTKPEATTRAHERHTTLVVLPADAMTYGTLTESRRLSFVTWKCGVRWVQYRPLWRFPIGPRGLTKNTKTTCGRFSSVCVRLPHAAVGLLCVSHPNLDLQRHHRGASTRILPFHPRARVAEL